MKKILTIAIPTFNAGKNLERAIKSCQNIKIPINNYEILIVDNCSTDDSIDNIKTLKNKFENLIIIKNEKNIGRIENWNACIDNANGRFLIFLFSNDTINENNNIHECVKKLDDDEKISIVFSSLIKKEIEKKYLKKSFFQNLIVSNSECFIKKCLNRGLLPFGPIQSLMYRMDDIEKDKNRFLTNMPINADEIFTYKEVKKREKIIFNPNPQVTWDLTKERFHGKMKIEEEFKEHSKTIKIISEFFEMEIDYGLVSTYRAINLIKFATGNFNNSGKKEAIKHLLSKMKKDGSFFNTDIILLRTFVTKIKNSKKDADDILYSSIISDCLE